MTLKIEEVRQYLMKLQDSICNSLEKLEADKKFTEQSWQRPDGGGGRSRVIEINISHHFKIVSGGGKSTKYRREQIDAYTHTCWAPGFVASTC